MAIAPSAQPCNHAFETLRQKWIMKKGSHVIRDRSTNPMVLRIGKVLPTPIAAAVCNAGRQ
jgi:hypothetical protein